MSPAIDIAQAPPVQFESGLRDFLYTAALLAHLGPEARAAAAEIAAAIEPAGEPGRTCIDAGGRLMLSVAAPGGRSLRVLARCSTDAPGVMRWRRWYRQAGASPELWISEAYGATPAAFERASIAASRIGAGARLRRMQEILGLRARIYSVSWRTDGRDGATVSWQLDRSYRPQDALAALGFGTAWSAVPPVWQELLGFTPGPRSGPWSILLPLHGDEPRVRVGSTNWALKPEEPDKRRRLVRLIDRLGGDARYADAMYKLMESAVPPECRRAVGRAAEIDIVEGTVTGAEFYLCLPEQTRITHTIRLGGS